MQIYVHDKLNFSKSKCKPKLTFAMQCRIWRFQFWHLGQLPGFTFFGKMNVPIYIYRSGLPRKTDSLEGVGAEKWWLTTENGESRGVFSIFARRLFMLQAGSHLQRNDHTSSWDFLLNKIIVLYSFFWFFWCFIYVFIYFGDIFYICFIYIYFFLIFWGYFWDMLGIFLGYVWDMFGIFLG